jgi:ParB family chromosome partitioning protein
VNGRGRSGHGCGCRAGFLTRCFGRCSLAKCREATKVRREFVKTLLARRQAPKDWQYFTVHAITHHSETASGYEGKVAAEMVGAKAEESNAWAWNPLREHVAKTTARPKFSLIALVCAGYEKTIAKDSWRSPGQTHRDYLTQLVTWGYVDRT